ncbi:hypothetical protein SAMN05720606_106156 [Paenibacillus polysaccharolyticus]|uniref:Nucleotidyltransferase n=1 Tax=Paenibacillus polysaccharolyticus TaxID=582692 RepID=A0A1G5H1A6_9BACL|nr:MULTISPECIES: hypothetical protein [Paenibacillus]SCY57546.1 hypothetical protein SAMN05720606_106156 [Paenibacillus polysaccharolyticus]
MERIKTPEIQKKIQWAKEKLIELAGDVSRRELKEFYVMGIITPILDELDADPAIIVGGHAVELYTSGSYKTADVDLVMIRDDLARALFDELGFVREGRHYYVSEMDIPIEIPSDTLEGSKEKIIKLNTPEGYCYVIGIDDLILDRLRAAEFWSDARSLEWARYLMYSQFDNIDLTYIRNTVNIENIKLASRFEKEYQWVIDHMFE